MVHRVTLAALLWLTAVMALLSSCTPVQHATIIEAPTSRSSQPETPFYPAMLPRSAWTKGTPDASRLKPMPEVKRIVVCHSGDPRPFVTDDLAATAQHLEYTREYDRIRGCADIRWHYAIDHAGRVWELRSPTMEPQAVRENDAGTIAVVIMGNYNQQELTAAQKHTLINFLHALRLHHDLPATAIFTKQELIPVESPGHNAQAFLTQIRREHRL